MSTTAAETFESSLPSRLSDLADIFPEGEVGDTRRAVVVSALAHTAVFCGEIGSRKSPALNGYYEEAIESQVDKTFQFKLAEEAVVDTLRRSGDGTLTIPELLDTILLEYHGVISDRTLTDYFFEYALGKSVLSDKDHKLSLETEQ